MTRLPESFEAFAASVRPQLCAHPGCKKAGRWTPLIKVWAMGHPKSSTPLPMALGIAVCDAHLGHLNADTFWTEEGKAKVRYAIEAYGKAEPDFSTTEIQWLPVRGLQ